MPWSYEYTHTHVRTYLRTYSIRHRFRMGEFLGIIRSEKWKMCAFFLSRVRRKRENCQLTRPRWNGRRNETMTGQESNPLAFGNWEAWVDDWQLLAFVVCTFLKGQNQRVERGRWLKSRGRFQLPFLRYTKFKKDSCHF